MKLAVIPARGGSKRIPRKNINSFAGKPMIAWSIHACLKSGIFDRVFVSTDDDEIADMARSLGAEVPFKRPQNLSDDNTPTVPVVSHAVGWAEKNWTAPQYICCVYATAPFLLAEDLRKGFMHLKQSDAKFVFPVTSFPFPIQRGIRIRDNGRAEMLHPEHALTRSQDLEEAYHDVGQFYWGTREAWIDQNVVIGPDSAPIIIPRYRAQDIDTPEDWAHAELLFQALKQI